MKWPEDFINKIICGDCLEVLKQFPDNSIDTIITDPPYNLTTTKRWGKTDWDKENHKQQELEQGGTIFTRAVKGFMGKEWDGTGITFSVDLWKEVLRISKPGATLLCFGHPRTWHRLACAIEDADWIIKDTIMWIYGCLSEDSEILTSKGWKKYNEIKVGDEIFSLSLKTKNIKKNKIKKVFVYEVKDEPMLLLENHNTSQLLTLNHKILLREYKRKQENYVRKGKYDIDYKYVDAYALPIRFKIPLSCIYEGKYSIGKDFAELIGWIISEGNYHKDTNAISIYQSAINFDKIKRISYILGRLKIKYSYYQRQRKYKSKKYIEHQFYFSGDIVNKIKEIIPDKKLNWELLELPYREKERLLTGLLMGDGSKGRNNKYQAFYQKDLEQLEIFQALLHLTNKQGWINSKKHSCSIHYNNETEFQEKHKKRIVNYTGVVWCVQTELGNFIARRNGKVFITGNSGFPKSLNIAKSIAKKQGAGSKGNTFPLEHEYQDYELTPDAKFWVGWGTALKPAWEPIIMAMKPNEGSYAENALKWGVAGLNIDGGRIKFENTPNPATNTQGRSPANLILECICDEVIEGKEEIVSIHDAPKGTFAGGEPNRGSIKNYRERNVGKSIIHTNPECPCYMLDKQSGIKKGGKTYDYSGQKEYQVKGFLPNNRPNSPSNRGDSGGASRFFYCAKASRSERGENNKHPTVKPLKLMEYLCILTKTPTGGVVLDPFAGSGTTGVACKKTGRDFILIEKEPEYVEIARKRLEAVKEDKQQELF